MKTSSAKNKGRLLQQFVRDKIYEQYPDLKEGDVRSTSMGASGTDVLLSPLARSLFNYAIECKSRASFVGYSYYDQAIDGAGGSLGVPIVVVKANRRKPLVIIDFEDFMELNRRAAQ